MACIHNQQKEQKKQHSGHLVPYNKIALYLKLHSNPYLKKKYYWRLL